MRKTTFCLLALAICVVLGGQAPAAEAPKAASTQTSSALQGLQRSSQMIGMAVKNPQGQSLGKIDDLVIGQDGTVKYIILSHGGLLGIGDKLIPIPWKALKSGPDEKALIINVEKKTLENAPNFDPKEWPNFIEPAWQKRVEVYYELPGSPSNR